MTMIPRLPPCGVAAQFQSIQELSKWAREENQKSVDEIAKLEECVRALSMQLSELGRQWVRLNSQVRAFREFLEDKGVIRQ